MKPNIKGDRIYDNRGSLRFSNNLGFKNIKDFTLFTILNLTLLEHGMDI